MTDVAAAGAYAIVRGDMPAVYLAEDANVLARVLALHLVAQLPARSVASDARLREMRAALLEERWRDALVTWMDETDVPVDVYEEQVTIWTRARLDDESAALEIRMSPLFSEKA